MRSLISCWNEIIFLLQEIPNGDWFCPSCCCGICGQGKFQDNKTVDQSVLTCGQCEQKCGLSLIFFFLVYACHGSIYEHKQSPQKKKQLTGRGKQKKKT